MTQPVKDVDFFSIKIDNLADNFVVLSGENVYVGGSGIAGILKNMNSLTSIDAKNFRVFSGDVHMIFEGDKFYSNARGKYKQNMNGAFTIDDINIINNGRAGKMNYRLVIDSKQSSAKVIDSDRLVAGRQTFTGAFGVSSDVYVTLDREDYENLRTDVEGAFLPSEALIETMMNKGFSLHTDVYIPRIEGVRVDARKYIEDNILSQIEKYVNDEILEVIRRENPKQYEDMDRGVKKLLEDRKLRREVAEEIQGIIRDSMNKIGKSEVGKISIELRNNPSIIIPSKFGTGYYSYEKTNPSLIISVPGKEINVNLNDEQSLLMRLILEGSLRAPDYRRMENPSTDKYFVYPRFYWPSGLLKDIWYQNLGQSTQYPGVNSGLFFQKRVPKEVTIK